MDYIISLGGNNYTLTTNDPAEIAAITQCRINYNKEFYSDKPEEALKQDTEYLQKVYSDWRIGNQGFTLDDLNNNFKLACASWAGKTPPEIIIPTPELTADELKTLLMAYLDSKHTQVLNGGVSVNNILITTDLVGRTNLTGAYNLAQSGAVETFNWVTNDGPIALTKEQIIAIATAVGVWVQATYTLLGEKMLEIANGTITSKEEIDSIQWPTIPN